MFFQNCFFSNTWYQKVSNGHLKTTKNQKHLQKATIKTHARSRPATRLCLEGVKPLKLIMVARFQLIFQRPRALKKGTRWVPQWSLRAPQIPKSQKILPDSNTHIKNTTLQHIGYYMHFGIKKGCLFRAGSHPQITQKSSKWAPGLQKELLCLQD